MELYYSSKCGGLAADDRYTCSRYYVGHAEPWKVIYNTRTFPHGEGSNAHTG